MMSENCTDCDNRDSHDEVAATPSAGVNRATLAVATSAADPSAASVMSENCTDCDSRDSHDEMAPANKGGRSARVRTRT